MGNFVIQSVQIVIIYNRFKQKILPYNYDILSPYGYKFDCNHRNRKKLYFSLEKNIYTQYTIIIPIKHS